jgi:hypothetical protein
MARPIIVTAVTTANGAHFGPGECHGNAAIQPNNQRCQELRFTIPLPIAAAAQGFYGKNSRTVVGPVPDRANGFAAILLNV